MEEGKYPILCPEISWLSFNERVLQEAEDSSIPVISRLRFLGIFSNNLDEFFKTKYAHLKRMLELGLDMPKHLGERSPQYYLNCIHEIVEEHQKKQEKIYNSLICELRSHSVFVIDQKSIPLEQEEFLKAFFYENLSPNLSVLIIDEDRPLPALKEENIYLAVRLSLAQKATAIDSNTVRKIYALISIPSHLDRFVVLPKTNADTYVIYLDDIIRYSLSRIFSTFSFSEIRAYAIKFNRDAEITIDDDISRSLFEKVNRSLNRREKGDMVRLVYDRGIPKDLLILLSRKFNLQESGSLVAGGMYHSRRDLMEFPSLNSSLERKQHRVLKVSGLDKSYRYFDQVLKSDYLICTPYHNFFNLIKLLREAAIDPEVHTIKISLYRLAAKSCVVSTLVNAAQNGKSVFAFVELKAKFDEKSNMYWANVMRESGVKVVLNLPSLKVHSKIALIIKRQKGVDREVVFVGTGNMNEKTAKVYSDMGLLTAKKSIAKDVSNVFAFLENGYTRFRPRHIWLAPHDLRQNLQTSIDQEIKNKKKGLTAFIRLKINSLTDVRIARKLYKAAEAGVSIQIICRGMCVLIPDSYPNMEVISIVDGFLEHFRIYHFANKHKKKELLYISSADIMRRNLDKRVEVAVRVCDPSIFKQVVDIFDIQWADDTKARVLNRDMNNQYRKKTRSITEAGGAKQNRRAQEDIYTYYKNLLEQEKK